MNAEPPTARFQMEHQPRRPGYAGRYAALKMIRIHTTSLLLLIIALGCGQQAAPKPAVDTNSWTLTVNRFSQLDSQSALIITVDTPVPARVTFHEPHSQSSLSFLAPGSTVYDIRKTLEPTGRVEKVCLK